MRRVGRVYSSIQVHRRPPLVACASRGLVVGLRYWVHLDWIYFVHLDWIHFVARAGFAGLGVL